MIRDFYKEDARRCARWFINDNISPECEIKVEQFQNHFEKEWSKNVQYAQDNVILQLDKALHSEEAELFKNLLLDENKIKNVICSKSNMAATGIDGISNAIWKMDVSITAKLVKALITSMLHYGRIPSSWRKSRTIMLYKKGDPKEVKSWRPIALTPTLYRIVLGQISNTFLELNQLAPFINTNQKGFKKSVNGAAEHIATINELIADANRKNKDIQILALDFANAFGTVSHKQIANSIRQLGFPNEICELVKNLYKDNTTFINVANNRTEDIRIERGVRQGCPLSPILFNICLEPLIRLIDQKHKEDGYKYNDEIFCIQAFADDVVLISSSVESMRKMLDTVDEFCTCTGMKLTTEKCQWLSYCIRDRHRVASSEPLTFGDAQITAISIEACINYLGAPIATCKKAKYEHTINKIKKIRREVDQILVSPITFTQSLDAIRRLIIPEQDYILLNGVAPMKKVQELDRNIRGLISKKLCASGIPTDLTL